jgi:hypothetical protein
MLINRRAFLVAPVTFGAQRRTIRVATGLDRSLESATRGFELGVEEARRSASLLGVGLELTTRAKGFDGPAVVADGRGAAVALPRDGVFHILPTPNVQTATLARWREANPSRRSEPARVVAWHHTLERYGARQLNDRFERRFNQHMDADAWSAWMAVKVVAETSLRRNDLLQMRFDGHKGAPLAFDPTTRYLQQPLYVVTGAGDHERVVAEI